jgi:hypothetical protein
MGNSGIPPGLTDVLGASVGGVFGGSLGAGLGSMEYSPKEGEEYSMDNMFSPTLSSLGGYGGALGGMAGGTRVAKNFLPTKNGLLKALLASAGGTIGGAALGGYGGGALGESLFAKD